MLAILFIGIWAIKFLQDQVVFITMVGASTFYFSSSKQSDGSAEVLKGVKYACSNHAGSIAFGSLIITVLEMLKKASEQKGENKNILVSLIHCCCSCIMELMEAINKNGYAYMAITGDSYCTSAQRGFIIWLTHFIEYQMAQLLAGWLIFTGTLFITAVNTLTFVGIYKAMGGATNLPTYAAAAFFISLFTTGLCLNQFDEAVAGILMSMAIDEELNGDFVFGPVTFHEKMD